MAKIPALIRYAFTRPEPAYLPLSIPAFKPLLSQGLPRGIIAEISGPRSSARTSAGLHILAQATARGEVCAVIDLFDSFHPCSANAAGIQLDRVLWVRCRGHVEYAIRTTDLLLHAGGFGIVLLDLCEANPYFLNRIPLSYWYRFRRAIENTPSILLICANSPQAKSCSPICLELKSKGFDWTGIAPFLLLRGLKAKTALRARAASPVCCMLQAVV